MRDEETLLAGGADSVASKALDLGPLIEDDDDVSHCSCGRGRCCAGTDGW
jgi:hypothetical protein